MADISVPILVPATAIAKALADLWPEKALTAEEAFEAIRKAAIKSSEPKPLYASIGTAEVTVLLARRYLRMQTFPASRRLLSTECRNRKTMALRHKVCFQSKFKTRPKGNLGKLKSLARERNLGYEERFWPKLPLFHGFIYGDDAFVGRWTVDEFRTVFSRLIAPQTKWEETF